MTAREHSCADSITLFKKGWENTYVSNANLKPQSILIKYCIFVLPPPAQTVYNKAF